MGGKERRQLAQALVRTALDERSRPEFLVLHQKNDLLDIDENLAVSIFVESKQFSLFQNKVFAKHIDGSSPYVLLDNIVIYPGIAKTLATYDWLIGELIELFKMDDFEQQRGNCLSMFNFLISQMGTSMKTWQRLRKYNVVPVLCHFGWATPLQLPQVPLQVSLILILQKCLLIPKASKEVVHAALPTIPEMVSFFVKARTVKKCIALAQNLVFYMMVREPWCADILKATDLARLCKMLMVDHPNDGALRIGCKNILALMAGSLMRDPLEAKAHLAAERSSYRSYLRAKNVCGATVCSNNGHLKLCSGCKAIFYCSKKCQKKSWKSHKEDCNK